VRWSVVSNDLDAIDAANTSNTALAGHVSTAKTDLSTQLTAITSAASKFSTDVGTLKTDLATLEA